MSVTGLDTGGVGLSATAGNAMCVDCAMSDFTAATEAAWRQFQASQKSTANAKLCMRDAVMEGVRAFLAQNGQRTKWCKFHESRRVGDVRDPRCWKALAADIWDECELVEAVVVVGLVEDKT